MASVITVPLPEKSYPIAIAPGNLDQLGPQMQKLNLGQKVLLVSNPTVFPLYGERAIASLTAAGFTVSQCLLPDGEAHKTPATLQKIYDVALENRLERSSTMVALGGGVIGDMTGFAAATWLRGINVVQVPTTLLAMVDASIGGKTGVNHPQGKNLIGAFHQPSLVLIDPDVLKTLPVREFRAGMAEVIKYGIIWDAELFSQLERAKRLDEITAISDDLLTEIIYRSCQSKADVVSQDEKESGLRAILNYGHTIGHAVESLTGYTVVNHGEAVGIGMVFASKLALLVNQWSSEGDRRQLALIEKTGLPTSLPAGLNIEEILVSLTADKKVKSGQVRFILPMKIGEANISDQVTGDMIRQVLS